MSRRSSRVVLATTATIGVLVLLPITGAFADDVPGSGTQVVSGDHGGGDDQDPTAGTVAAPFHVHVHARNDDAVTVEWRFDGDAASITGFTVTLTSSAGGVVTQAAAADVRSVVLTTLAPDTRYSATVTAVAGTGTDATSARSNVAHTHKSRLGRAADDADDAAKAAARHAAELAKAATKAADRAAEAERSAEHHAAHAAKQAAKAAARAARDTAKAAAKAARHATELRHRAEHADAKAEHERDADQQDERPDHS